MIDITFLDSGREPRCPPDPKYPDGMLVDLGKPGGRRCAINVPYPAPRCGSYLLVCQTCGVRVALTVAGRPDDPRVVALPCRLN